MFQFNGNDPVGLFNNDILIDIIGTLGGGSSNFAKDVTLIRKSTISNPNAVFDLNEWDSFAQDNCSNIGMHTTALGVNNYSLSNIAIYPNPTSGNTLTIDVLEDVNISVFDILGKQVLRSQVSRDDNQIDISRLNSGMYLIRLKTENGSVTKKFIKK